MVNQVNYKVVYVSPLRRAIQTAVNMFKTHPNKANIKFKVFPLVTEVFMSTCDIGNDVFENEKEFSNIEGMHFDFTLVKQFKVPQLWQTYQLEN